MGRSNETKLEILEFYLQIPWLGVGYCLALFCDPMAATLLYGTQAHALAPLVSTIV